MECKIPPEFKTEDALTKPVGKVFIFACPNQVVLVMKVMRKYKEKDPEVNIGRVYAVFDEEGKGKISVRMDVTNPVTAYKLRKGLALVLQPWFTSIDSCKIR